MLAERAAKIVAFPRPKIERRRAAELQFLPAALEIIETPVSPIGLAAMWAIVIMIFAAILWACVGKVDIIATASGRIIPTGQVKLIQPMEIGVVKVIHVADGDRVRAGDVLIELDPTTNAADQGRVERDLMQAKVDAARLNALLGGEAGVFIPPAGADSALVESSRRQLVAALLENRAKVDGIDRQIESKMAERDTAKATIAKVAASLPIVAQRAAIYEKLKLNEYSSKVEALQAEQQLVEAQHDRAVAGHQLEGAEADIAALREEVTHDEADTRRQALDDLSKAEQQIAEQTQEQMKASKKVGLQTMRAPVDGTVEQLAAHTIGGVVTPAETLMTIVPEGSQLEIEAMLPNRDVGFVHPGQSAEVKVEAFTYTRYGLLHGQVDGVSRNTVQNLAAVASGKHPGADASTSRDTSDETSGDSNYVARISLADTGIETEDGRKQLEPGMTVTAEIKTGQRRVISYLLSPLLRYRHESLLER